MLSFLPVIGRILYGGFFVYMGTSHFMNLAAMTGYAASKGVPMPKLAVLFSGLMIFLGGLGIVFYVQPYYSSLLIALFLVVVTFTMHRFWEVEDQQRKMVEMVNFTKNIALLGAALMF